MSGTVYLKDVFSVMVV